MLKQATCGGFRWRDALLNAFDDALLDLGR